MGQFDALLKRKNINDYKANYVTAFTAVIIHNYTHKDRIKISDLIGEHPFIKAAEKLPEDPKEAAKKIRLAFEAIFPKTNNNQIIQSKDLSNGN